MTCGAIAQPLEFSIVGEGIVLYARVRLSSLRTRSSWRPEYAQRAGVGLFSCDFEVERGAGRVLQGGIEAVDGDRYSIEESRPSMGSYSSSSSQVWASSYVALANTTL